MASKLFQRLDKGETVYGANCDINQPEIMEIFGALGLDFLNIDMMMNSVDWRTVAAMTLAADRYDMTPALRLPAYPWSGRAGGIDHHLSGEILRAIAVGVQVICVSLETPEQIEAALRPISDPHRKVYLPSYELSAHGNRDDVSASPVDDTRTMLLPLIESELAIELLDDIFAVPGLEAVFLGMGDLSVLFGHPNDYAHPDLTAFVKDAVQRAAKHDVAIFANVHGRPTIDEQASAVKDFEALGVKGVFVPRDSAVLVRYYKDLMERIR